MGLFRNLGFDGMDLDVPAGSVQLAAMAFVAATYLILTVQESVEEHLFMQDEGNWQLSLGRLRCIYVTASTQAVPSSACVLVTVL